MDGRGFSSLMGPNKGVAAGFSLLLVGAALWPIVENWREKPKDNFPLSYYPMFSAKRGKKETINYIIGYDAQGARHIVSYTYAGTGGMNQVRRQINTLVKRGEAERLCRDVAARLAAEREGPLAGVVTVQVISGTYRLSDYFSGNKQPVAEEILASAPVEIHSQINFDKQNHV
jgi:hypothetical protein